jgi:hypothetical protein
MTVVFGMYVMTVVFWNVGYDCWFTVVFGKLAITALSCFWNVGYDSCFRIDIAKKNCHNQHSKNKCHNQHSKNNSELV